jgi:uncharacterized protein (DUF2384 family)
VRDVASNELSDLFEARLAARRSKVAAAISLEISRLDGERQKVMEADGEIVLAAIDCLGSYQRAAHWLTSPEPLLAGESPLDAAATPAGKERVFGLLWRQDFGAIA